jgi:tetratricopeptide (TPR) repeat protein
VLVTAAKAPHAAIRSAALAGLGVASGDRATRRSVLLAALDDPARAVRISALAGLINQAAGPLEGEDRQRFRRVGLELAAAAKQHEDDAAMQHDLGLVRMLTGDLDSAAEALEIAIGLEADRPSVRFLLGMVRFGQGRMADALTLLKAVPPSDPYYRPAQAQLQKLPR